MVPCSDVGMASRTALLMTLGTLVRYAVAQSAASNTPAAAEAGGMMAAFTNSFAMIIVTELGDKTFFIAASMALLSFS